jgi:hypothetical protein
MKKHGQPVFLAKKTGRAIRAGTLEERAQAPTGYHLKKLDVKTNVLFVFNVRCDTPSPSVSAFDGLPNAC